MLAVGMFGLMSMVSLMDHHRLIEHANHPHENAVHIDDFEQLYNRVEVLEDECSECLSFK